jgi:hypothetical protein
VLQGPGEGMDFEEPSGTEPPAPLLVPV